MAPSYWTWGALVVAVLAAIHASPQSPLNWDETVERAQNFTGLDTPQPLLDKVCVITGPTSGMGLALTHKLSMLGATVVAVGRSPSKLARLKQDIPSIEIVQADLMDLDSVSKAADAIISRFDRIDFLINNAGFHDKFKNLWGTAKTLQGYDPVFAVNYLSHFLLTEKLLDSMLPANENSEATDKETKERLPVILQISSTYHWAVDGADLMPSSDTRLPVAAQPGGSPGYVVFRSTRSYANSKLAQIYHARALQKKYNNQIRVVSVCPAWVATQIGFDEGTFGHWVKSGFAYPVHGWGVASSLYALLDTDSEQDYFINSAAFRWTPTFPLPVTFGIRDAFVNTMAFSMMVIQKFFPWAGPNDSSPESYNETIANALYQWSYEAVAEYL